MMYGMSAPRLPTQIGSTRWIVTLAAMTAVVALSIDMSLPAQPVLAHVFAISPETAQLNLSLFMVGFAVAQLIVGYLSDVWGRRRVLIGGLVVFSISAVVCAASTSIEMLLVFRTLQGIGGSTAPVVARAMVRDTQPAAHAARLLSTMLATLAIAPMIAPSIGGLLLDALNWRAIFATLAACGITLIVIAHLTLSETLPVERRLVPSPGGIVRGFATFFSTPGTKLPLLIGCASFAGQFAYIAGSPFVLMHGYGVSTEAFGIYFGATAFALMLGSLTGARMLKAGRSPGVMIVTGTSILLVGGILVTIGTHIESLGLAGFIAPLILYFFGVGVGGPSATALALEPVAHIAGTASAAIGFLTMTSGALSGYLTTKIGGNDPRIFALVVTVMGVVAWVVACSAALARSRRLPS